MITPEERAADEAVIARATPGPWRSTWGTDLHTGEDQVVVESENDGHIVSLVYYDGDWLMVRESDAAFIAAARTRWPAYMAENADLRAENAKLAAECEAHIARLDDTIMDRAEATQLRAENAKLKAALEDVKEAVDGSWDWRKEIRAIVERVTAAQE